mgnify:CR=1 FL=1
MKRILIVLFFLLALTKLTYSQYYDPRLLWFGTYPSYNYLTYPNSNPPVIWNYETNPAFLYDGNSGVGVGKQLQSPNDFSIFFRHDSRFLWYNYAIPSPLMYMGVPNSVNPAIPWYNEPLIPGGGIVENIGPTIIIEIHIGKALQTPIETAFGKAYVDQGYYPYEVVQIMVPWFRLLWDRDNEYLFGNLVYLSTWRFHNSNFGNIDLEWIAGGGFGTNPQRPINFYNEIFGTKRSWWLKDGDIFVCQAKVTYLLPYSSSTWLSGGNYDSVWDITAWSNPIFLEVGSTP